MARFLFAATPAAGHVNPALPIIRALADAGHEVLLSTGPDFAAAAAAAGAGFVALPPRADLLGRVRNRVLGELLRRFVAGPSVAAMDRQRQLVGLPPAGRTVLDWTERTGLYLQLVRDRSGPADPAPVAGRAPDRRTAGARLAVVRGEGSGAGGAGAGGRGAGPGGGAAGDAGADGPSRRSETDRPISHAVGRCAILTA